MTKFEIGPGNTLPVGVGIRRTEFKTVKKSEELHLETKKIILENAEGIRNGTFKLNHLAETIGVCENTMKNRLQKQFLTQRLKEIVETLLNPH